MKRKGWLMRRAARPWRIRHDGRRKERQDSDWNRIQSNRHQQKTPSRGLRERG
jgi:hypothetical protein